MIEVPSAVYIAFELAEEADFLSVGSNDLTQYLLAVDRTNARVADMFDGFHPAVLRALEMTSKAGIRGKSRLLYAVRWRETLWRQFYWLVLGLMSYPCRLPRWLG